MTDYRDAVDGRLVDEHVRLYATVGTYQGRLVACHPGGRRAILDEATRLAADDQPAQAVGVVETSYETLELARDDAPPVTGEETAASDEATDTSADVDDVEPEPEPDPEDVEEDADADAGADDVDDAPIDVVDIDGVGTNLVGRLLDAGIETASELARADEDTLTDLSYVGKSRAAGLKQSAEDALEAADQADDGDEPDEPDEPDESALADETDPHKYDTGDAASTDPDVEADDDPATASDATPSEDASTDGGLAAQPTVGAATPGELIAMADVEPRGGGKGFVLPQDVRDVLGNPTVISYVPEGEEGKRAIEAGVADDNRTTYVVDDDGEIWLGTLAAAGVGVTPGASVVFRASTTRPNAVSIRPARSDPGPDGEQGGDR